MCDSKKGGQKPDSKGLESEQPGRTWLPQQQQQIAHCFCLILDGSALPGQWSQVLDTLGLPVHCQAALPLCCFRPMSTSEPADGTPLEVLIQVPLGGMVQAWDSSSEKQASGHSELVFPLCCWDL